jgi:hypothetical protein
VEAMLSALCETELMAKYPAKDVASWLGNSVPVAMEHYAMATAESFQNAIAEPTLSEIKNGGSIKGKTSTISKTQKNEKTRILLENAGF